MSPSVSPRRPRVCQHAKLIFEHKEEALPNAANARYIDQHPSPSLSLFFEIQFKLAHACRAATASATCSKRIANEPIMAGMQIAEIPSESATYLSQSRHFPIIAQCSMSFFACRTSGARHAWPPRIHRRRPRRLMRNTRDTCVLRSALRCRFLLSTSRTLATSFSSPRRPEDLPADLSSTRQG